MHARKLEKEENWLAWGQLWGHLVGRKMISASNKAVYWRSSIVLSDHCGLNGRRDGTFMSFGSQSFDMCSESVYFPRLIGKYI
jgi:hypothetical protein